MNWKLTTPDWYQGCVSFAETTILCTVFRFSPDEPWWPSALIQRKETMQKERHGHDNFPDLADAQLAAEQIALELLRER